MNEPEWLADQFEANRVHLQAVAYRMLGSLAEADDAVQESSASTAPIRAILQTWEDG
jgi:DNA-directed RNA polymerase specialized sigma24 family protein